MDKRTGFTYITFLVLLVVAVVGSAAILTQIRRPYAPPAVTSQDIAEPGSAGDGVEGTADWQTYRSEQYGFEIKYPQNFVVEPFAPYQGSQYIAFFESDDPIITSSESVDLKKQKLSFSIDILLLTDPVYQTIVEWADKQRWPFPDSWRNHFSVITIAGVTAIQDKVDRSVWVKKENTLYGITNGIGREDRILFDKPTFDAILSTFKFISQDQSTTGYTKTSCSIDSDCVLWMCAGPLNKEWAKEVVKRGIVDLPCATYYPVENYAVRCVANQCTATKK